MIRFEDVTFSYRNAETACIRNFSYSFSKGSITAVTGFNGCGKTTLMKLATGVLRPDGGKISVDGEDESEMDLFDIGKRIGYVNQNPERQLFCQSVFEEIAYGLKNMGLADDEINRRADYYLEYFRLGNMKDAFPGSMSQGEKQRVMLACVMAMGTEYIILDEPTNGLDMRGRKSLGEMLVKLKSEGKGIIIVSHERSFIDEYADCELDFGKISEDVPASFHENVNRKISGKEGFLGKLDPRPKIYAMLLISTVSVISDSPLRLACLLALMIAILIAGGIPLGKTVKKVRTELKLIFSLFILQCIFTRTGTPLIEAAGFTAVTVEGAEMAAAVCLRLLILTCSALLLMTGESRDYLLALTQMKMPYEIAFMVMLAIRFIPILTEEASDVMNAVQMRGTKVKGTGPVKRAGIYLSVTVPVVAGTVRRGEQINIAMSARCFRLYPERTDMRHLEMHGADYAAIAAVTCAVVPLLFI